MKNIIVLALSTLPSTKLGTPEPFDYTLEEEEIVVRECISQLEPVVRMIAEKQAGDLELLVLCTPQVEKAIPFHTTLEPADILGDISALGYFILRLARKGIIDSLDDLVIDHENDSQACFTLGKDRKVTFSLVRNIQETTGSDSCVLEGVDCLVKRIRELYDREECNLYVAANGGFRDTFLIISGILSMLKLDGIAVDGIYSTDISRKAITDVRLSFDMFEFVSGLNEFDRYGDMETIERYFVKRMGEKVRHDDFLNAMRKLSDGLSFCNVVLYEEGLEDLSTLLGSATLQTEVMKRPEFSIFRNDIEHDYHDILNGEFRYIEIIRRCLAKNRVVQALTFAEAKFSLDLYDHGILFFDPNARVRFGTERANTNTLDYIRYCISHSKIYYIKDPITFALQEFTKPYKCGYHANARLSDKVNNLYGFRNKFKQLLTMVEDDSYVPEDMEALMNTIGVFKHENLLAYGTNQMHCVLNATPHGFDLYTALSNDDQGKKYTLLFSLVLGLYYALKEARNTFNHGDQYDQPDSRKVMTLIQLFCDCSEVLLRHKLASQTKPAIKSQDVVTQYRMIS